MNKDNQLSSLGNYRVIKKIGQGAYSEVFLVEREGIQYAAKILKVEHFSEVEKFKNDFRKEASVLARINHPNVIKVYEFAEKDQRPYIIMEYFDGKSVDSFRDLYKGNIENCIEFATEIARGLLEPHRLGFIHGDLKPENILQSSAGNYKIIDFGFQAALEENNDSTIIGTTLFASPEQLRLINRSIDSRSDLYSLGIILYELFTGANPFADKDIGEVLNKQAKIKPAMLHAENPELNNPFSWIVDKLLNKDPDDRYQSVRGLLYDLENINQLSSQLSESGKIELGARDVKISGSKLEFSGRDEELKTLLTAWQSTLNKNFNTVLVGGDPGIGKTRLIQEFLLKEELKNALVLKGKCQSTDASPFGVFKEALNNFLLGIFKEHASKKEELIALVRSAVGSNASQIIKFIPLLKRYLDYEPEEYTESVIHEVSEGESAFLDLIGIFLENLSRPNSPLVFIVDDIQWADEVSLRLLDRWGQKFLGNGVLVIGMMRTDEVSQLRLSSWLDKLKNKNISRIQLNALGEESIKLIIKSYLGGVAVAEQVFRNLISRSGGTPFILEEMLRSYLDSGVLAPSADGWKFSEDQMLLTDLSQDVAALILQRLSKINQKAKKILIYATAIGNSFDRVTLTEIYKAIEQSGSISDITSAIQIGLDARVIEEKENYAINFIHDKIYEALSSEIDKEIEIKLHEILLDKIYLKNKKDEDDYFKMAYHFKYCQSTKPDRGIEICQTAGNFALKKFAFDDAKVFFELAIDVARKSKKSEESVVSSYIGLAQVKLVREDAAGASQSLYHSLELEISLEDRIYATELLIQSLLVQTKMEECWDEVSQALKNCGIWQPKTNLLRFLCFVAFWFMAILYRRWPFLKVLNRKKNADLQAQAICRLLVSALPVAYFSHPTVMAETVIRLYYYSLFADNKVIDNIAKTIYGQFISAVYGGSKALSMSEGATRDLSEAGDPVSYYYARGFLIGIYLWYCDYEKVKNVFIQDYSGNLSHADSFRKVRNLVIFLSSALDYGEMSSLAQLPKQYQELLEDNENFFAGIALGLSNTISAICGASVMLDHDWKKFTSYFNKYSSYPAIAAAYYAIWIYYYFETDPNGKEFENYSNIFINSIMETGSEEPSMHRTYLLISLQRVLKLESSKELPNRNDLLRDLNYVIDIYRQRGGRTPVQRAYYLIALSARERLFGNYKKAQVYLFQVSIINSKVASPWLDYLIKIESARIFRANGAPEMTEAFALAAAQIARKMLWKLRENKLISEFGITNYSFSSDNKVDRSTENIRLKSENIRTKRYVDTLLQVNMATSKNLDPLMQARAALDAVVQAFHADRAFLFIGDKTKDSDAVEMGRSKDFQDIAELKGFSRSVIERVKSTNEPVLISGTDDGEVTQSQSMVAHNLRSIMVAPLVIKNTMSGVLYCDSTVMRGLFNSDDLEILSAVSQTIAISIEMAGAAILEVKNKELEKEMQLSAAVQSMLLPSDSDIKASGLDISGYYRAATLCSGDWWWYDGQNKDKHIIIVGDVTGHGAGSAMVTAAAASAFRALRTEPNSSPDLYKLLKIINDDIANRIAGKYLMTLCAVLYDAQTRELSWYLAGAPGILVLDPKEEKLDMIVEPGSPIGLPELSMSTGKTQLNTGSKLLIYTDGLVEQEMGKDGRQFGERRVQKLFQKHAPKETFKIKESFMDEWDQLRAGKIQGDDVTFVVLEVK